MRMVKRKEPLEKPACMALKAWRKFTKSVPMDDARLQMAGLVSRSTQMSLKS